MPPYSNPFQTGILVIAHAPLASAMVRCVLHIFPDKTNLMKAYDVTHYTTPDSGLSFGQELACQLPCNQLLVFTDIVGATPFNIGKKLMETGLNDPTSQNYPIRLISGTNIPMLVKALTYNQSPIDSLTELVIQGAQHSMVCIKP